MAKLTKIRLRKNGSSVEVLVLVNHPMETGWRKDDENNTPYPAQYIQRMSFELNGELIAEARLGPEVAANPLTGIALNKVKPGDKVAVRWSDNLGAGGGAEAIVGK